MSERAPQGGGPEDQRPPEPEPVSYVRAARFGSEVAAGRVYRAVQDELYLAPACDLSVYRLLLDQIPYVAVLGQIPPRPLARRLDRHLAAGAAVSLPPDVLGPLTARRHQQIQRGPWVEGHYRPGRPLE